MLSSVVVPKLVQADTPALNWFTDVIPEQRTIITKKALSDDLNSKL